MSDSTFRQQNQPCIFTSRHNLNHDALLSKDTTISVYTTTGKSAVESLLSCKVLPSSVSTRLSCSNSYFGLSHGPLPNNQHNIQDEKVSGSHSNVGLFPLSSAFQPIHPSSCPYTRPSFDKYSRNEYSPISLDIRTGSSTSKGTPSCELKTLSYPTDLEDVQSVIEDGNSSKINIKSVKRLSRANSSFDWSEDKDFETESHNNTRRRKTPVQTKDETYWQKREKNNIAAKKSREAKRRREFSTQQRATFLEIENTRLHLELSYLRQENQKLKRLLGVSLLE